ncbi:MAG: transcription termination/antitermination protein NusA [Candidatus Omnitrophica bacterium]|nr:transcription termination/antitermination protein NusA [Candidatus Omnitrophota bacterium]
MNGELLSLIDAIVREKGIDREVLIQAIESALASAFKKGTADTKEVTVTIDRTTGQTIVLCDGQKLSSTDFSRIGAQTAKQVIMQKIREAEREVIFAEFQGKVGDIVSGTVHRFERGDIVVDLGRTEALLPKSERIPHEEYQQGERIQAYILDVRKGVKGTEIILSRAHEAFIKGLFLLEVPEIHDGIVEVKAIAREAGDRTKLAVFSKDEKVDCVGACVGMRGTRVKNIVRELHGEKIDIIRWHEALPDYIAAALAPAKIAEIELESQAQQAGVIVDDDQLSLAIGKKGQNVRLAAKLTGWQLEIHSKSQRLLAAMPLSEVKGIGPSLEERLKAGGISTVQQLAGASVEQLTAIKGIGEKTATTLIESAKDALQRVQQPAASTEATQPTESTEKTEPEPTAQADSTKQTGSMEPIEPTQPTEPTAS